MKNRKHEREVYRGQEQKGVHRGGQKRGRIRNIQACINGQWGRNNTPQNRLGGKGNNTYKRTRGATV